MDPSVRWDDGSRSARKPRMIRSITMTGFIYAESHLTLSACRARIGNDLRGDCAGRRTTVAAPPAPQAQSVENCLATS
jgi:hypothetical protein